MVLSLIFILQNFQPMKPQYINFEDEFPHLTQEERLEGMKCYLDKTLYNFIAFPSKEVESPLAYIFCMGWDRRDFCGIVGATIKSQNNFIVNILSTQQLSKRPTMENAQTICSMLSSFCKSFQKSNHIPVIVIIERPSSWISHHLERAVYDEKDIQNIHFLCSSLHPSVSGVEWTNQCYNLMKCEVLQSLTRGSVSWTKGSISCLMMELLINEIRMTYSNDEMDVGRTGKANTPDTDLFDALGLMIYFGRLLFECPSYEPQLKKILGK